MNELELHAYGEIAHALAERAYWLAGNHTNADAIALRFPDESRQISEYALVEFETLTRALWSLHIVKALDETPQRWAYHFAFECSVEEYDQVAERNWETGPSFPRLLKIFVDFFDGYGKQAYDFSSAVLTPFGRNGRMTRALDALVAIGYVEEISEGYIWTDVGPVMLLLFGFKSFSDPQAFKPTP